MLSKFNLFKRLGAKKEESAPVVEEVKKEIEPKPKPKEEEPLPPQVEVNESQSFPPPLQPLHSSGTLSDTMSDRGPPPLQPLHSSGTLSDTMSDRGGSGVSELESPRKDALYSWIHGKCPDILISRVEKYVDTFIENGTYACLSVCLHVCQSLSLSLDPHA